MTKAFVLHSGGLDSTTALFLARKEHGSENVLSVSVDYNQRHRKEIDQANKICELFGIGRAVLKIEDMPISMLTDASASVPNVSYADLPEGVSPTYVPFR